MFLLESENSFVSQFLQPMFYCFRENSTENRELRLKEFFAVVLLRIQHVTEKVVLASRILQSVLYFRSVPGRDVNSHFAGTAKAARPAV